jgi:hypothetical protein
MAWRERASTHHHSFLHFIFFSIIRLLQFVLALTVCGLYGQDLNNARMQHKYADGKWVYAVVVGGLSAFTSLVFMIPFITTYRAFGWDLILL